MLSLEGAIPQDMFGVNRVHIGFSGLAEEWGQVVNWFCEPTGKPPRCKRIEFLMLTDKQQIYHATNMTNWMLIPEPHFAIGSGMQFAIAAMSAGKQPIDAVKIASKHDPMTGMGFKSYTF